MDTDGKAKASPYRKGPPRVGSWFTWDPASAGFRVPAGFPLLAAVLVVLVTRPGASGPSRCPPREVPRTKVLLACATEQVATLAVTIGERGNLTKVVELDGEPSFLVPAIKTVRKVLRPPSPPSLVEGFPQQLVETVTLHCIPPGIPPPLPPRRPFSGPIHVGGNIRPPLKWLDVAPVYPQPARDAGVQGPVIVEAIIGIDGSVQDVPGQQAVRIRESVPQLDKAAVYAVRQWRFTPTVLNGVAVPVIMTFKVDFEPSDPRTFGLVSLVLVPGRVSKPERVAAGGPLSRTGRTEVPVRGPGATVGSPGGQDPDGF